ncbi:hypothetical protein CRM22_001912 [Opisthorchis felineus]|uniref:Uncharacterized protein n=1 Tax=Opisthorchis felineus TaxID=147828 RepID=A0A4S2M8D9_OPIFE|nr:hypothetical protein CRM22_001912 [Opisthorchis felineus]
MVARAILDDLFKKLKALRDDADSLSRLSVNLQNYKVAPGQTNHTSDSTMARVLRTLSKDARRNWARSADTMDNLGKQIGFSDVCYLVSQEARKAGSRYGMIAVSREEQHRPQTQQHRVGNDRRHTISTIQEGTYGLCPLCDGRHGLAYCHGFADLSKQARWRVVKRKQLRLVCLKPGHARTKCDSPKECGINSCSGSKHHLLHVMPDANKDISVGLCSSTS